MNIIWLLLGAGPFFGWWCVVVDIFWLVVGSDGWWWVVVGSGGYILGGGGCWWIYFGWWWVVVDIFWLVVGGGEYILTGGGW